MKINILQKTILSLLIVSCINLSAQVGIQQDLQYYRNPGFDGLNVFENSKGDSVKFDGVRVKVGGDFALQFQGIDHSSGFDTLVTLGNNFNLPTANLLLDVQLAKGMRMHLSTYLSSRHHVEANVKGGYLQVDNLDFISKGFLDNIMSFTSVRVGMDEFNYGDAHYRRSDNARAIYNPFVGNYIMDAFSTEVFGEITFQPKSLIVVLGITNGNLNQSVNVGSNNYKPTLYAKYGWDKQINEDLRFRLTVSILTSPGYDNGRNLYGGDRAGARYYWVMNKEGANDNFTSGRFNPRFQKFTAFQINPFVKYKGLEFFGIYEVTNGDQADIDGLRDGSFTQIAGELLYRFGSWKQFYVGARYNLVEGNATDTATDQNIDRYNIGGGWFMTKNVVVKAEYVNQTFSGDAWKSTIYQDGEFKGAMLEAVISF